MKPKNEAYHSAGRTKPYKYGHHPFSGKRRLYDRKNNKAPLGEKQAIEAYCRFGNEISEYLSTALKGWDVWVNNKAREHIILQDDA